VLGWDADPSWFDETWLAFWQACATRDGWMPAAGETLGQLRAAGLGVGIVSNCDETPLQALAAPFVDDGLVDFAVCSEAAGSCKPDGRIFEVALSLAGVAAEEAVYVGDSLLFDVVGANRAGMRSVLLTQAALSVAVPAAGEAGKPDHTIAHLDELPGVIGIGAD
jgi:HAD superfamily hydrolase (TIGR01549 family)